MLDPLAAQLVDNFDVPGRRASWKFGDQAPAETSWRKASAYPFTIMKTLALTKPAKFFSLYFDPSRLSTNTAGKERWNRQACNHKVYEDERTRRSVLGTETSVTG